MYLVFLIIPIVSNVIIHHHLLSNFLWQVDHSKGFLNKCEYISTYRVDQKLPVSHFYAHFYIIQDSLIFSTYLDSSNNLNYNLNFLILIWIPI